ncbi:hypothetical protein HPB47_019478 [Ixodes persulcatus]|uniref:Uncharacterized protein n=1 Tax=Ixodes persulcatus TaxID=34615 RepID=A0AC60QLN4_IXOPE|nr:hypothetical protein HPB47_019478 [Ixodes persulcatus]
MSSVKEISTAKPSREYSEPISASAPSAPSTTEYKILLPPLPNGKLLENSLILHGDPSARPYRIDDFGPALKKIINPNELASLGAFQYNHVWLLTVRSSKEKERLLQLREIQVKNKTCLIIDGSKTALSMKVHWVPTSVPDANVASVFSTFGKIKSIVRDKWHYSGFEEVETTTRILSIELNEGVTADSLPHQLKILGTTVLVSIPGRAPQCLRCRQVGHVRGQCRAPWCGVCRKFGHDPEDCIQTYANRTAASLQIPTEDLMDAKETAQTEVSAEVSTAHSTAHVEAVSRTEKCEDRSASSRSAMKETVSNVVITNSFSALRAESKRRRKRRTKSSSPKAPISEQDSILSGHDDLKRPHTNFLWVLCGHLDQGKNSDSSSDVPQQPKRQDNTSLTVIFVPVKEETRLSALNSLKVSEALEKLCQECIIQVRPNDRLNLIAVDVRNGQAAKTLLNTAMLCAVPVRAYSPLSGPSSYGVIQGVDAEITEDEIARNLRAEDTCCKIANVGRLGRSRVVKVAFTSTKLSSYVLLGHTDRYNVTIVTDLATRKSPANVRRPVAVAGNTMTGRVLNDRQKKIAINKVPPNDVPSDERPMSSTQQPSSQALPRRQATKRSTERKESDETSGLPIATTPAWVSIINTVANISLAILSKFEASAGAAPEEEEGRRFGRPSCGCRENSRAVGNGGRLEPFLAVGSGSAPGVAGTDEPAEEAICGNPCQLSSSCH